MTKKLFLSYTAEDLFDIAQQVKAVAKSLEWEVVDHKDWSATGRPSVKECLLKVDECDALLVLSSNRYGWNPTRKHGGDGVRSITWLEFERAQSRGIPVFPFISDSVDADKHESKELIQFQNVLRENICCFFGENIQDLEEKVESTLGEYDGLKRDDDLLIHRWLRILVPLAFFASLEYFWFFGAPVISGYIFDAPILTYTSWALTPVGALIALLILFSAIYWSINFDRGKPQLIYRIFPLNFLGIIRILSCGAITLIGVYTTFYLYEKDDSAFEHILYEFTDGNRNSSEVSGIDVERWHGSRKEADIRRLREYVVPIYSARDSLSQDLTLAAAREDVRKLNYDVTDNLDSRVQLLVEMGRFQVIALDHSAGEAIQHYETVIVPLLRDMELVWQAEAAYAYASWVDYWMFTNKYPSLNRDGAPDYTLEQVLATFKDADLIDQETSGWLPWVACAVKDTGANILVQHCGGDEKEICGTVEDKLKDAKDCYTKRSDGVGVLNVRNSFGLRLDARGKTIEAYQIFKRVFDESGNIDAGIKAIALQALAPVEVYGDGINLEEIDEALNQLTDLPRVREIKSCLNLIKRASEGARLFNSNDCRVAYNCYLTDGMLTRNTFCGIPDVAIVDDENIYPLGSNIDVEELPSNFGVSGKIQTKIAAEKLITDCNGDVDDIPSMRISFATPVTVTARVYSSSDSVLLVKGKSTAFCNDDAPIIGRLMTNELSAALRLPLEPGSYDFYAGVYGESNLEFQLRVNVEAKVNETKL